jgi:protein gp37
VFGVRWGPGQPRHRTGRANWRKPIIWNRQAAAAGRRGLVFCASLADVFDAEVPASWRENLWALIRATENLDWQLLTKRPENIAEMLPSDWGDGWANVWLGISAESQELLEGRWAHLALVSAKVQFVSAEPLLGPLDLAVAEGLDWIITGGESGPGARPADPDWFRSIRDQCASMGIALHHKQNGGVGRDKGGAELDGLILQQRPAGALARVA